VRVLVQSARRAAAGSVNTIQVHTNFQIGRLIVEHEQRGTARAEYGKRLIGALAERLTAEFGRGFSRSNLQNMRVSSCSTRTAGREFARSLLANCRPPTFARSLLANSRQLPRHCLGNHRQ
jgi:hypothetical protein